MAWAWAQQRGVTWTRGEGLRSRAARQASTGLRACLPKPRCLPGGANYT